MLVAGAWDVVVNTEPIASVTTSVRSVGDAVTRGKADILKGVPVKIGEYVLVPRSVVAIWPTEAGTDVLRTYGDGAGVSVARGKFGSVVPTVIEAEEKYDEITVEFWTRVVILLRGYNPIVGGSLPLIPKL